MAIQVSPENVVGRDGLIERIWKRLLKNSLRFTAERRIGKTTVMTKMAAEPKPGYELLFMELEGIDSPDRFAELVLNRVRPLLSGTEKAKGWFDSFRGALGGTEVGGIIKLPGVNKMGWQATLEKTLEGVCAHQEGKTIVLLFDEMPYMLQKIAAAETAESQTLALTLLDTLRSIRQKHPANLRMIYAGSVGLHHVVSDLKQGKLASEPTNDMPAVEIHALNEQDAWILTERLLGEEKVELAPAESDAIIKRIACNADYVPFYIEAVCSRLGEMEAAISIADVDNTVRSQLNSDLDPWEMEHFRGRLEIYYRGVITDNSKRDIPNAAIAREILDHLALATEPQSIEEIWLAIKSKFELTDRQHIVQMLKSLAMDHYLTSDVTADSSKQYSFRYPLIQNWWKMVQGLNG